MVCAKFNLEKFREGGVENLGEFETEVSVNPEKENRIKFYVI